ncbi:hypothetical protein TNCV_4810651 [Trichonephila clavipes]|nr:hypothetical protein TNCV_4810651 [Trichonephila clavipes]
MDHYEVRGIEKQAKNYSNGQHGQNVLDTFQKNTSTSLYELPLEDRGRVSVHIVFCNVKVYSHIIFKEYRHCSTQIILCLRVLHGDISTDVAEKRITHPTFYLRMRRILHEISPCVFKHPNAHLSVDENPDDRLHAVQHRFSVQVRVGVVNDLFVVPYLLTTFRTSADYLIFFQELLPNLLDSLPQFVRHHK